MTRGGPGYQTSTTTTFMFLLKQSYIGESAAMSVLNFGRVVVIVLVFLRVPPWTGPVRLGRRRVPAGRSRTPVQVPPAPDSLTAPG